MDKGLSWGNSKAVKFLLLAVALVSGSVPATDWTSIFEIKTAGIRRCVFVTQAGVRF